jgi:hypothetical protein
MGSQPNGLCYEFEEGDMDLIKAHPLSLWKCETGRGRHLLIKYDGPLKLINKMRPVSYGLKMAGWNLNERVQLHLNTV